MIYENRSETYIEDEAQVKSYLEKYGITAEGLGFLLRRNRQSKSLKRLVLDL